MVKHQKHIKYNENAHHSLQTGTDYYQATVFQQEIEKLIAENKRLSLQLQENKAYEQNEFESRIQQLQTQLIAVIQEKDSAVALWQSAQKTIDALENELLVYQNDYEETPQNRSDLQSKFYTALEQINESETKLKEKESEIASLRNEIKAKDSEISIYKEKGVELEALRKKFESLTEELISVKEKRNLDVKSLEDSKNNVETWKKKEREARLKVREALDLLEKTIVEKELLRQQTLACNEQVTELNNRLEGLSKEFETKFEAELNKYKDKFNEKIGDMLDYIHGMYAQLEKQSILAEKLARENDILKEANKLYENQDCMKHVPMLEGAEKRVQAAFQELILSERRNIKLSTEKECLIMNIREIKDKHEIELKRRDWEENLLKNEIKELKNRIDHLQKCLQETHAMIDKLQKIRPLDQSCRHEIKCSDVQKECKSS